MKLKLLFLLIVFTFLLTGCNRDQSAQRVPEGWKSLKTVEKAIVALPADAYEAKDIIEITTPFKGYSQKFVPKDLSNPLIVVSTIEVSLSERWDLFRNGPKNGEYLDRYLSYYNKVLYDGLLIYARKIYSPQKFEHSWNGTEILQNDGAFKSSLMMMEGQFKDRETGAIYKHAHFIWEKNGRPYIISFFIDGKNYEEKKEMIMGMGFSLYP